MVKIKKPLARRMAYFFS